MARLTVKGFDEYLKKLEAMGEDTREIVKRSLYEGAGVVADSVKSSIGSLAASEKGLTEVQKQGLSDGFGIARMREAVDSTNVKIGFHGVNGDGKPNTVIARMTESGSSRRKATPFFNAAVNRSRSAALSAIQKEFDDQLRQKMS